MKSVIVVLCLAAVVLAIGNSVHAGRYYQPQIGRWATPDPALRDKLPNDLVKFQDGKLLSTSPYGYAFDNPLRYTDPDGKTPWDIIDIAAAALSIKDFIEKPTPTNALLAGADVIGAAVPVVPSPGTFRHGARLLGKVDDVVDFVRGVEKVVDVSKGAEKATEAITVYRSVDEVGNVQYVGITKNFERRAAEHLREKGIEIRQIPGLSGLSRTDARAVEQALIELHRLGKEGGTLLNKINSIAKTNPNYAEQLQRGMELLKQANYPEF